MAKEGKPVKPATPKVAKPKTPEPSKEAPKTTPKKPATKKAATKKRAAPKKPVFTDKDFTAYFFKLDLKRFREMAKLWNEANLKITIPEHEGYDDWLNYFKTLTPSIVKQLALTGVDFLPTEAYAALSRWHDIISHPARIDKIYQAGLTRKPGSEKTIAELAQQNDRIGVLKATRDKIAEKLDKGAGSRDTALLTREMTDIMAQIAEQERRAGPKKGTKLNTLLGEAELKRRPKKGGGGTRKTSFSSRVVTIKDVEGE